MIRVMGYGFENCPFCGSQGMGEFRLDIRPHDRKTILECSCGASMCANSPEKLVQRWNTRWKSDDALTPEQRVAKRYQTDNVDKMSDAEYGDWVNKLPKDEFLALIGMASQIVSQPEIFNSNDPKVKA